MSAPAEVAFAQLAAFLRDGRRTGVVADLEQQLTDADASQAACAGATAGVAPELLVASMLVRRDIGRINDFIHAAAITLALPHILEPGERLVNRPSLAAGNSPTQHYDVETDRRIAEFKLAAWSGTDATRKRGVFHDLVHLAADNSGRSAGALRCWPSAHSVLDRNPQHGPLGAQPRRRQHPRAVRRQVRRPRPPRARVRRRPGSARPAH